MSWTAKIRGVDELAPELQAAVRFGIEAGAEMVGIEGQRAVQANIASEYNGHPPAVFTGNLMASIQYQTTETDQAMTRLVIGVGTSLGANVYAAPVETGARPHFPPASALVPWVMKKFGADDEKTALSMAFAVAKSIAKRGTPGHEMFSRALEEMKTMAPPIIEHQIAQALIRAGFGGQGAVQ
jgi:hypothetical protein